MFRFAVNDCVRQISRDPCKRAFKLSARNARLALQNTAKQQLYGSSLAINKPNGFVGSTIRENPSRME